MRRTLISAALATSFASLLSASAFAASVETTTQLPRHVRPLHYDVSITPDAKNLSFLGRAAIKIEVKQPTDSITLHALEIAFDSAVLRGDKGKRSFAAPVISLNEAEQTATFRFNQVLPTGRYELTLDYRGKIGTQAAGLFAVDYAMADGKKRALYTQFENSDARRMLPSWDEPAFRTSFTLEANVPSGEMAVSNMPVEKTTELGGGRTLVRFAPSPKMSTYLLFFGLGEFDRRTQQVDGTELGVITKRGATGQASFALESSAAVLRDFNDYFGVRYPLPKLDNVAAPGRSQFFSAMENWGAIFSFEYSILLDPAISSQVDKQRAFQVAAHEIAHQWFGNLVTMRWWDDLWLNEGFASWMEARTTERLHPEWNTALAAVGNRESAMNRDALVTTHPVVQHVETVEQASQAFDAITYSKGQAVVHMLENYVGAEAWRKGVRSYIKKHAYGNTVSDDLWKEIQAAAGKPVMAIAHDFTLQPGVPLIRVGTPVCKNGQTVVPLTQSEFSLDRPDKKPLRWRVPVVAQALGSPIFVRTMVAGGKASLKVAGCAPVLINAGQGGYYRTVYTPEHFRSIAQSFAKLAPIDQLGVMSDSWSLGLAGLQSPGDFLDLVKAAPVDADPQIWGKVAEVLAGLDRWYRADPAGQAVFRKFAVGRLAPVLGRVGWQAQAGELDTVAILRNDLIDALGVLGDEAVVAEARRRFSVQATDPSALPGPLRKTILGVVALHADAATWEQIRAAAQIEKSSLVKEQFFSLLASTRDAALAQRALELALTEEPGETISASILSTVARRHPDMAFDFALANIAVVNLKVDASSRSRFFPGLAGGSIDPAMVGKVNGYATTHLNADARRDAETAAAGILNRIKVRRATLPAITSWLAGN